MAQWQISQISAFDETEDVRYMKLHEHIASRQQHTLAVAAWQRLPAPDFSFALGRRRRAPKQHQKSTREEPFQEV